MASTAVYFVQDDKGMVKIGFAGDPLARLGNLQTGHAGELHFIRLISACGEPTERWLHKRFAASRIRGEWFRFDPEMMTVTPPDEVPVREAIKPRLKLTLKEALRDHDRYPLIADDQPRLLAALLTTSFDDDDARDFIQWVRDRVHLPIPSVERDAA